MRTPAPKDVTIKISIDQYVGRKIAEARKEKGWSQVELAKRMGHKTSMSISWFERGERSLTAVKLYRFAEALGKPINYFLPSKP